MYLLKHSRRVSGLAFAVIALVLVSSCNKNINMTAKATDASLGNSPELIPIFPNLLFWNQLPNLPFPDAVAGDIPNGLVSPQGFAINGKGYLCGGMTITSFGQAQELKRLWEYDTLTHAWTQKADFPDATPDAALNFVIGRFAYIVVNGHTWQYSQATNTWTQKANMPGPPRGHGTGFSVGKKGYAGLGFNLTTGLGDLADFYEYDPVLDKWNRIAAFPGSRREGAMSFVIGQSGYVCSGLNYESGQPTVYLTDLWQYDAATNAWAKKQTFPANGRAYGVGLSGLGFGYAGTGSDNNGFYKDFWKYNATTNAWTSLPNIGAARDQAGPFFIGRNIYVCGGTAGLDGLKDFWTLHF